jgi:hypothetical protein
MLTWLCCRSFRFVDEFGRSDIVAISGAASAASILPPVTDPLITGMLPKIELFEPEGASAPPMPLGFDLLTGRRSAMR